ncbi:MAG: response regulator [Candidatus Margulisiibacteriota bacterium]
MFKPLILVVDDEKDFADHLAETIRGSGKYDAKIANSAKQAFMEIEKNKWFLDIPKNRIACIILDIKMPEMDGMQFLEKLWEIRKEEYEKSSSELNLDKMKSFIPVIILSAWEDDEKWKRTPRKLAYLRKPVKEEELFAALDRITIGGEQEIEKMKIEVHDKGKERGFLK